MVVEKYSEKATFILNETKNEKRKRGHRQLSHRYFQHAHFITIVGVGEVQINWSKGDLPRQHPFGTTLRFTGPVTTTLGSERQRYAIARPDKLGTDPMAYHGLNK